MFALIITILGYIKLIELFFIVTLLLLKRALIVLCTYIHNKMQKTINKLCTDKFLTNESLMDLKDLSNQISNIKNEFVFSIKNNTKIAEFATAERTNNIKAVLIKFKMLTLNK